METPPIHGIEVVTVKEQPEAIPSAKLTSMPAFDRGCDNLTHPTEPPSNTVIQAAAVKAQPIEARHVSGVEAIVGAKHLCKCDSESRDGPSKYVRTEAGPASTKQAEPDTI